MFVIPMETNITIRIASMITLLLLGLGSHPSFASEQQATLTQPEITLIAPRNTGYEVGDVIHHQLQITPPSGYTLQTGALPPTGPYNDALEIHNIELTSPSLFRSDQYILDIDYQIFHLVRDTEEMSIPSIELRFQSDEEARPPIIVKSPSWVFSMAPLIPKQTQDNEVQLQPPMTPASPVLRTHYYRLIAGIICLVIGIILIARKLDWIPILNWNPGPFRKAHRAIRQLNRQVHFDTEEHLSKVLKELHQAFNETAGNTLLASQLGAFFQQFTSLRPLESRCRDFFAVSEEHFFASDTKESEWLGDPTVWVEKLARDLSLRERGKT